MRRLCLLLAFALVAACGAGTDDDADERLRVVTSGGFAQAYARLAPRFAEATGIDITTEYGASTGGAPDSIPERLARGEHFDLVILSRESLDALTEAGHVVPASRTDLARSRIGIAVREGATVPDIATPEAFRQALLDAESIGLSASVSGTYLATGLFPRLGLSDELAAKSVRIESERVAAVVARGEVEIGFQQVSEIVGVEGAVLVGPIPGEYQKVTTFGAGITTDAANPAAARRLLDYLAWVGVAPVIAETGLEPVAAER
ncbi:MAG: substrate-binding domain-containing protein [Woeseiaceae bacterium]|nr:substrate-binding domain-containing protein [Woeseiaceae bacterium]